ncbi:hypothetical protein BS17DRAFT_513492 [Gyrodon lividus]|nr:hypothetical protein BS17DRAFT_513492 [Gyrodon lividus]
MSTLFTDPCPSVTMSCGSYIIGMPNALCAAPHGLQTCSVEGMRSYMDSPSTARDGKLYQYHPLLWFHHSMAAQLKALHSVNGGRPGLLCSFGNAGYGASPPLISYFDLVPAGTWAEVFCHTLHCLHAIVSDILFIVRDRATTRQYRECSCSLAGSPLPYVAALNWRTSQFFLSSFRRFSHHARQPLRWMKCWNFGCSGEQSVSPR